MDFMIFFFRAASWSARDPPPPKFDAFGFDAAGGGVPDGGGGGGLAAFFPAGGGGGGAAAGFGAGGGGLGTALGCRGGGGGASALTDFLVLGRGGGGGDKSVSVGRGGRGVVVAEAFLAAEEGSEVLVVTTLCLGPPLPAWYAVCSSVALLKISEALIPMPESWSKSKFSLATLRLPSSVLRISTLSVTVSSSKLTVSIIFAFERRRLQFILVSRPRTSLSSVLTCAVRALRRSSTSFMALSTWPAKFSRHWLV